VLSKRLASYRALTEPLIHYYSERRKLLTVDGMMTIEHVTREINRILAAIGAVEPKGARKAAPAKRAAAARKGKKPAKTARKADKPASRAAKKPARAAKASSARRAQKSAKRVTKKRAKR